MGYWKFEDPLVRRLTLLGQGALLVTVVALGFMEPLDFQASALGVYGVADSLWIVGYTCVVHLPGDVVNRFEMLE
jgi:hypothetical protein